MQYPFMHVEANMKKKKIAVIIPCYNEEIAIGKVVRDFKKHLPQADIYVYDNNSTDKTVERAREAGAIVRSESRQGKGYVMRRMFADIEADIYVTSDGDETYDIAKTPLLIKELEDNNFDMVIGARREVDLAAYRVGHRFGNLLLTKLVQYFFNYQLNDMLSGFRVFSKRFVKTFPAYSGGFEIETELTVYALSSKLPIKEIDTDYFARPQGSVSKLSTYRDGFRILMMIVNLVKEERPLLFFSLIALFLFLLSLALGIPVIADFAHTGLVARFPTAILAMGIMLCSVISLFSGFILDTIAKTRKENRRMQYLRYPVDKDNTDE